MTARTIEQRKEKYAYLEEEINIRKFSFGNYDNIKRAVITADATAKFALLQNYEAVSKVLALSGKPADELRALYAEVITPMNSELFEIRTKVIGQRRGLGFGTNMAPMENPTEEAKNSAVQQFSQHFASMLNDDSLKDKKDVKAVVIYPLVIAPINTWRKYDYEFAGKLIENIRSNEPDESLKTVISVIDIPVVQPRK